MYCLMIKFNNYIALVQFDKDIQDNTTWASINLPEGASDVPKISEPRVSGGVCISLEASRRLSL